MQSPNINIGAHEAPSMTHHFNLHSLNERFKGKAIQERLRLIHDWVEEHAQGRLALTSSFGVQSALLLHYVQNSGLDIPVISVDIDDPKYNQQRAYRDTLRQQMGFELLSFPAANDAGKVQAMDHGLRENFITATIAGIRASQTQTRADKNFAEWNSRNNTFTFHPLLDWPDAKTEFYLQKHIPDELRHPAYQPGLRSQGGAILSHDQEKTECGLHIDLP